MRNTRICESTQSIPWWNTPATRLASRKAMIKLVFSLLRAFESLNMASAATFSSSASRICALSREKMKSAQEKQFKLSGDSLNLELIAASISWSVWLTTEKEPAIFLKSPTFVSATFFVTLLAISVQAFSSVNLLVARLAVNSCRSLPSRACTFVMQLRMNFCTLISSLPAATSFTSFATFPLAAVEAVFWRKWDEQCLTQTFLAALFSNSQNCPKTMATGFDHNGTETEKIAGLIGLWN